MQDSGWIEEKISSKILFEESVKSGDSVKILRNWPNHYRKVNWVSEKDIIILFKMIQVNKWDNNRSNASWSTKTI